jgi:hypothetical protein
MPVLRAEIVPALLIVPPMLLFWMVMPVRVGATPPVAVMTPVPALATLPVTVMPFKLMQLMEPELLTELWLVTGVTAHGPANDDGVPPATSNAITDDDANRCSDRRATPRRLEPPEASDGVGTFGRLVEQALDDENDWGEVVAIIGIGGWRLRVQRALVSLQQRVRTATATDRCCARTPTWRDMVNRRLRAPQVGARQPQSMNFRRKNLRAFSQPLARRVSTTITCATIDSSRRQGRNQSERRLRSASSPYRVRLCTRITTGRTALVR